MTNMSPPRYSKSSLETLQPPSATESRSNDLSASTLPIERRPRKKVALAPGHSPLDWAKLKTSGADLRGIEAPQLLRVPPSVLKQHRYKHDAWTAIRGKVYNITPYLPFHPGGEQELMRCAGRDGTLLFAEVHAWVNVDNMLDRSLVGILVSEAYR